MSGRHRPFAGIPDFALLANATRPAGAGLVAAPADVVNLAERDAAERLAQLRAGIPNHVFKMPPADSAFEAAHGASAGEEEEPERWDGMM